MAKVELTLEEHISELEHSNLPTIIVEGKDDIIIYRQLENIVNADVKPVHGRNNILAIFHNFLTNPKLRNKKILFIADKDTWVNTAVPVEYQHHTLIFTEGYSIENEVFIDYSCEKIIYSGGDTAKKLRFDDEKQKFIYWYALALQSTLNGSNLPNRELSTGVHHVLNEYSKFSSLHVNEIFPTQLQNDLIQNYTLKLRGKSLLELFTKTYNNHKPRGMFEQIAVDPRNQIKTLFSKVEYAFNNLS